MTSGQRQRLARLLLFVAPAMMAVNFYVARRADGIVSPHLLAFGRWLFAAAFMLPFVMSELRGRWPLWRREWPDLLVLGALGMWICGAFVYIGGQTTTAVNIGLLYAMSPVMIAVASAKLFGERLAPMQMVGVALAAAGMLVVIMKGSVDALLTIRFGVGDLWILVAVLAWTAYSILLKARPSALDPLARLCAITIGGLLILTPLTIVEVLHSGLPTQPLPALALALLAALVPGIGAYHAYLFLQRELGASRTGLVLYLGPLYAMLIGWLLLDEQPRLYHGAGAALILPGIWLATRADKTASGLIPNSDPSEGLPTCSTRS